MAVTNVLIERIENVKIAGQSYKDSNLYKNRKDEIEKVFLPTFDTVFSLFKEVMTAYNNLKKIEGVDVSLEINVISNLVSTVKDKVMKDEYDKAALLLLQKTLNNSYQMLSKAWSEYIIEKTNAMTEILVALDRLISGLPEKQMLQTKKNTFSSAKIGSQTALTAIEEYTKIYNELMNILNLKPEILEFLKKLSSSSSVSIADMSDDVYNWIKTSDFANKIVLKIN